MEPTARKTQHRHIQARISATMTLMRESMVELPADAQGHGDHQRNTNLHHDPGHRRQRVNRQRPRALIGKRRPHRLRRRSYRRPINSSTSRRRTRRRPQAFSCRENLRKCYRGTIRDVLRLQGLEVAVRHGKTLERGHFMTMTTTTTSKGREFLGWDHAHQEEPRALECRNE